MNALLASARAEFLRLRKWPAYWIVLGVWILLNLTFAYLFNYLAYTTGDSSGPPSGQPREELLRLLLPAAVPEVFTQGMAMFGGALMLVLGALAVGSGYGWGSWKTVFTQGPSRVAAVGGLVVSLAVTVLSLVVVAFVVDTGVAALIAASESQSPTLPSVGRTLLGLVVGSAILGMWTLAGALIGVIARGPALAVGLGLVWVLVVETLLRGVANIFDPIAPITDYLPGTAAGSLAGSMRTADGPATPGVLDILTRTESFVVLAVYAVVFAGGTAWLMRRRDMV
ncbi:ABC-type transport system involved in multi-copper enzyme maturation, permease component [Nocardia otitidiscaviarum]|uniref:ABC-type transport system involved in multi-copper enzyme maturation, permease component n=1 Tax=Nocardia otitidiscaviarum TaxID=1823 RepID=A0A378YGR8_9NOCA|nr:ABC transporter permease subunit [Nocardia otitidiscaviarum]SUA75617.1 ABC-type transport system involved in multi-copper enzyme maturation, permease component [Nocardia otitidiscaviarum]